MNVATTDQPLTVDIPPEDNNPVPTTTAEGDLKGRDVTKEIDPPQTSRIASIGKALIGIAFIGLIASPFIYNAFKPTVSVPSRDPVMEQFPKPAVILKYSHILDENLMFKNDTKDPHEIFVRALEKHQLCPDPEDYLQYQHVMGTYEGISENVMQRLYGSHPRLFTDKETRDFYNTIVSANHQHALKEFSKTNLHADQMQIAEASCETRHAARMVARDLGSFWSDWSAKAMDLWRHGSLHGQTCEEVFKKYGYDPKTIIEKSGTTNEKVNAYAGSHSKKA